jgi:hypothetical protein
VLPLLIVDVELMSDVDIYQTGLLNKTIYIFLWVVVNALLYGIIWNYHSLSDPQPASA